MQQSNTPMILSQKSQAGLVEFHKQSYTLINQQWNLRAMMMQIDLDYIREKDWTKENIRARIANNYGDADRFQNVTVPVVMPQVESAVAYQAAVFLTGQPIFDVVADPAYEDEAIQMGAVIEENSIRGGWTSQLMMFFRDCFKYNLGAMEVTWDRQTTASLETDVGFANGLQGKPKEVIWEGNCLNRWDLYNTFWDTRVPPADIPSKGEFVGNTKLMTRIALKAFINTLPDKMVENVTAAFNSGVQGGFGGFGDAGIEQFFIPPLNPMALMDNTNPYMSLNWLAWAGITGAGDNSKIQYKDIYEVSTQYVRLLPSDFSIKVPSANTPQIWKLIIVNHSVIIYAERQTNAHDLIPVLFAQANQDGLWYQTKSLAQNVTPIQALSSALMNSVVAARRRAISDRTLYDPSRITEAHINSANPSAKIPVRPSAYGKPVGDSVYPFPFRDDQSQFSFQQIAQLKVMGNEISGRNPAQQGQFVKGNKTLHEYDSVMQHAEGRDQMTAISLETQFFTPMKEILKINILQYQQGASYFSRSKQKEVKIDPVALRLAVMNFKVSDGLIPSDKMINADVLMVALQQLGSSPELARQYTLGPMFSYLMKTQGAHLEDFEKSQEQMAYEQAIGQWQQVSGAIAMALQKAAASAEAVKAIPELLKLIPPQPKPEDFGYNPNPQAAPTQKDPNAATPA